MFKNRQAGVNTLTLDTLDKHTIDTLLGQCTGKAPQQFFAGMPFVADLNQAEVNSAATLLQIKQLFYSHGLTLIGLTNHRCPAAALADAGLADIQLSQPAEKKAAAPEPVNPAPPPAAPARAESEQHNEPSTAQIIRQHVRSGQRIYAKGRDLIVIGAVSAGAELIADGHISVYGCLRGRAFAGSKGNQQSIIYCSELAAELISIAGCYQTMEQLEAYKGQKNCLVTLESETRMQIRSLLKLPEQ